MDCLTCELTRARLKAASLQIVGKPLSVIAQQLSATYGVAYYVEDGKLFRTSNLSPFKPHRIA